MKYSFKIILILNLLVWIHSISICNDFVNFSNVQTNSVSIYLNKEVYDNKEVLLIIRDTATTPIPPIINNQYDQSTEVNFNSEKMLTGIGNLVIFIGKNAEQININGLNPNKYYSVDVYQKSKEYKLLGTFQFTTLAELPSRQVQRIMWGTVTTTTMHIHAGGSKCDHVLFAISTSENDFVPVSGISYKSDSEFGKGEELSNGVYSVLSDNDTLKNVVVTGLKPGTNYYIKSFAFNGEGKSSNYLTETVKLKNYIRLASKLEAPVLKVFHSSEAGNCVIEWTMVEGAVKYELEFAFDENFEMLDENYGKTSVGDSNQLILDDLKENALYFVRVRAYSNSTYSDYSNVLSKKL